MLNSSPTKDQKLIKYGELIILGYNGSLPQGDRGRRRSKFVLFRRQKANGIVRSKHYEVTAPHSSTAVLDARQHSISYSLSRNLAVIVEYALDDTTDLFQIGRSSESPIDFVVMDTVPGNKVQDNINTQSTISRFSCRIIAKRNSDNLGVQIFAAGFDSSRNIFLGEKATKWKDAQNMVDGLTTNGVLIMHPIKKFYQISDLIDFSGTSASNGTGTGQAGIWSEVSVGGKIFGLRESRSSSVQGCEITSESNILTDGSLIDLCGATLLWRSAEGLSNSPTMQLLERCLDDLNAGRPQCPVGLHTLVVPRKHSAANVVNEAQPVVYLHCGHVQGRHAWGSLNDNKGTKTCPICLGNSTVVQLEMGAEPGFYVDCDPPNFCFVPCGHMASEKTVRYWASVPIPCGTMGFHSVCPFCAEPLSGTPGFIKLIFQDKCD